MSNTIPLPPHVGEESHGPSQSPVKLYDADQMHAHAAAVSAAKDARIKVLENELRKAIVQNEHDMLLTGDELRAARAVLGDKALTPRPSTSPQS